MPGTRNSIRRAEAAVEALSPSFRAWLGEEVQALVEACRAAEAESFSIESRQGIYLSAHALKGQAGTLGQPQIAKLAASLCRLLSHWIPNATCTALAAEHVAAIDEIYQDHRSHCRAAGTLELAQEVAQKTATLLEPVACESQASDAGYAFSPIENTASTTE